MSYEWSRVVSAEGKEEYMTFHGRLQDYSLPHHSKVKSFKDHLSLTLMRVRLVQFHFQGKSLVIFLRSMRMTWMIAARVNSWPTSSTAS